MASAVEEYLDRFDGVRRLAERNVAVADHLLNVSRLMRVNPHEAVAAISSGWPTAEQLTALITEMMNAESELPLHWAKLPEKYRNALPSKHHDKAGDVGYSDD
jgi:hypothetical protein